MSKYCLTGVFRTPIVFMSYVCNAYITLAIDNKPESNNYDPDVPFISGVQYEIQDKEGLSHFYLSAEQFEEAMKDYEAEHEASSSRKRSQYTEVNSDE